jgi:hypothetical protein
VQQRGAECLLIFTFSTLDSPLLYLAVRTVEVLQSHDTCVKLLQAAMANVSLVTQN